MKKHVFFICTLLSLLLLSCNGGSTYESLESRLSELCNEDQEEMVKNKAINDDFLKASPNNKDFYALRESAIETKSLSFRMEGKIGEKDVEYLSFDGNDLNITLSDTDTELWPTDSKVNIEFANPESGYLVLSVRAAGELIYIFKGYVHGETGDASYNGVVYSKDGKQPFAFKDSMGYWGN